MADISFQGASIYTPPKGSAAVVSFAPIPQAPIVVFQYSATSTPQSSDNVRFYQGASTFSKNAFLSRAFAVYNPSPDTYVPAFWFYGFQNTAWQVGWATEAIRFTPAIIDDSITYVPNIHTKYIFVDVPYINEVDEVYNPKVFNRTQYVSGATAIDQSVVSIPAKVYNKTQYFSGTAAFDQSQVYTPTNVYNLKQIFDAGTPFDISEVLPPNAYAKNQYISIASPIDQSEVASPTLVLIDQFFSHVVIDDSAFLYTPATTDLAYYNMSSMADGVSKTNCTAYGSAYLNNGEAVFNGTNQYFLCPGIALDSGNFTIEAWFKVTALTRLYGTIVGNIAYSFSNGAGNPTFLRVYQNNKIAFGGPNLNPQLLSTTNINLNEWYHVAISRDATSTRMYVNGVLEDTDTGVLPIKFSTGYRIGSNGWDGINSYFNGRIDDVRISTGVYTSNFNVLRNPTYVIPPQTLYNSQQVLTLEPPIDQSSIGLHNAVLTRQFLDVPCIDQSAVYNIDYQLLKAIYQGADVFDSSQVYMPLASNWIQYLPVTCIDQSIVEQPTKVYNLKQVITSPVAPIDQSSVSSPTLTMLLQKFSITTPVNQSSVYNPKFDMMRQVVRSVTIDQNEVYKPTPFNLKQVIQAVYDDFTLAYNPVVDLYYRRIFGAAAIDQSSVSTPTLTLINITYPIATAIDQSGVYNPKLYLKKQVVSNAFIDQGATHNPAVTLKYIDIHPTTIDSGSVYAPAWADVVNRIFIIDTTIDQSVVYAIENVTYYSRSFNYPTIDAAEFYTPLSVVNRNQDLKATLIDQSEVYTVGSITNLNTAYPAATAIDQSSVYVIQSITLLKQFVQGNTTLEAGEIYSPIVNNFKQEITAESIDDGVTHNPTFILAAQASMSAAFYTGESTSTPVLTINANHLLFAFPYSGEYGSCDITINTGSQMAGVFNDGAALLCSSIGDVFVGISNAIAASGETFVIDEIGNDVTIVGYDGAEMCKLSLITDSILTPTIYSGEAGFMSLDIHPSQGIGAVVMGEGSTLYTSMTAQYAGTHLLPNVIPFVSTMESDYYFPFELDLNMDCICSGPRSFVQTNILIDFDNGEKLFDKFYGEAVYMHVVLSRQITFQAVGYSGESAFFRPPTELNPTVIYTEMNAGSASLNLEINRFQLCKGNFRPSGSNTPLELYDALDSNCSEHYAYSGETAYLVDLQCMHQLYATAYEGDESRSSLTIYPPWAVTYYDVPPMIVELSINSTFRGFAADGTVGYVTFDTPFYKGWSGEAMSAILVTDYSVEFSESGSIYNEHIIQLPNGDIDTERTTIIPIETYVYRHDLKARCF